MMKRSLVAIVLATILLSGCDATGTPPTTTSATVPATTSEARSTPDGSPAAPEATTDPASYPAITEVPAIDPDAYPTPPVRPEGAYPTPTP